MAEPPTVLFEDQEHRRRRFELHVVNDALRIDLDTALSNYSATSFSRISDGLVLERLQESRYSALTFKPGETVLVEAVRPQDENLRLLEELDKRFMQYGQSMAEEVVKRLLPELGPERLSHLLRVQYADPAAAQPMQQDSPAAAAAVDIHGQPGDAMQTDHGLAAMTASTPLAMPPGPGSPQAPISEYNASGKKRRFCGACQNHNVRTPVTFQHQQVCPWKTCQCALCVKKRQISQAQAHKRHAAKAASQSHQPQEHQEQVVGHMQQPQQHQLQPQPQPEVQQQPQQEPSGSIDVENGVVQQQQHQPIPVPMPMGVSS